MCPTGCRYKEGLARFPTAKWYALVSESCLPCVSVGQALTSLRTMSRNQSWFETFEVDTPHTSHVVAQQWKVLSRKHALMASTMQLPKTLAEVKVTPESFACAPDEWIIATHLLKSGSRPREFLNSTSCTWWKQTKANSRHPDTVPVGKRLSALMKEGAENKALFVRKVNSNVAPQEVLAIMRECGVLCAFGHTAVEDTAASAVVDLSAASAVVDLSGKEEHIALTSSVWVADGRRGDFRFDIASDISEGRCKLYIFNDNHHDHKQAIRTAAGNAACYQHNRYCIKWQ